MTLITFSDMTVGSASTMKRTTVAIGTGAELAALDYSQYGLLICTADGSGFLQNHLYLCNADGNSVTDISVVIDHSHNATGEGGSLIGMFSTSPEQIDSGHLYMSHIRKADWIETVSGTGSTADVTNVTNFTSHTAVQLSTGGTSGSGATLALPGMKINYGDSRLSYFIMLCNVDSLTSIATHWGPNMETVTAADDNNRKFGVITCTATNGNWFARTANGAAHSDSDTGVAFTTNNTPVVCRLNSEDPTPYMQVMIDGSIALTKTTDIPIDSASASRSDLFKFSIKNSAGAIKKATLIKLRFGYWVGSDNFYG